VIRFGGGCFHELELLNLDFGSPVNLFVARKSTLSLSQSKTKQVVHCRIFDQAKLFTITPFAWADRKRLRSGSHWWI